MATATARPVPGPPDDWSMPVAEELVLPTGLRVLACDVPGREVAHASLVFDAGTLTEDPQLAGVGGLACGALLEGTERRSAEELAEAIELRGATISARCGWDELHIGVTSPVHRLAETLELLPEVLGSPAFPASEIERLRRQRLDAINRERFQPPSTAGRFMRAELWAADSRPALPDGGTEESVGSLDRDAAAAFFADRIALAPRTFVLGGDLSSLDVKAMLTSALSWAPAPRDLPDTMRPSPWLAGVPGPRIVVVDHPGAVQTNLSVGHTGPAHGVPGRAARQVGAAVLCSGLSSRLGKLLREKLGLTYGIGGGFATQRDGGQFGITSAVQTDGTLAALTNLLATLREAVAGGLTEDEVVSFRDGIVRRAPISYEDTGAVTSAFVRIAVNHDPLDELERNRAELKATTAQDASAALAQHLRPDELVVVASGDASKIAEPLATLGWAEVTVVSP